MKKKILLSAFACEPNSGSECYVGWSWVSLLEKHYDVHVLTREYSRKAIESDQSLEDVTFYYYDLPGGSRKSHFGRFIRTYYVIWQFFAFFWVRKLHRSEKFELIHHVTYNNADVPGFLWMIRDARFVWGAVGGGQIPPFSLSSVFSNTNKIKRVLRAWMKQFARINPIVYFALRKSSHVFYANNETLQLLQHMPHSKSKMLETAVYDRNCIDFSSLEKNLIEKQELIASGSPIKILWIGRLMEQKALVIALDALKRIDESASFEFTVVGDGEQREDMIRYAHNLNLKNEIKFTGRVPFDQINSHIRKSSIFVFTSIQDTSGNVVLESMSQGVPVVAFNHQGVKEIVGNKGGLLIDYKDYEDAVYGFSEGILKLIRDHKLRKDLSFLALSNIVDNHLWSCRLREIERIYSKAFD